MPHSRSFLANQKVRNAIVGAENLLNCIMGYVVSFVEHFTACSLSQEELTLQNKIRACWHTETYREWVQMLASGLTEADISGTHFF